MFNPHQRLKLILRAHGLRRRGDPEIACLPALVGAGRRAIDVGANAGIYTYWLSRACRQVEAFEPNRRISTRIAGARLGNVSLHGVALAEAEGEAMFRVPRNRRGESDHPGGRLMNGVSLESDETFAVPCRTLDGFAFDVVDFIKIDVEGHEEQVINGGWETIARHRPVMLVELEERHAPGCLQRVPGRLAGLGYRVYFRDDSRWLAMDDLAAGQIAPSGRYINNFLLVPPERSAVVTGR